MKKITKLLILAVVAAFALTSCQKMKETPHADSVVIFSVIPELGSAAGTLTVTVYATTDWNIEGENWLSVSPASGEKGISETVLQYSANSSGAARSAVLTLKAGTYTHTQTVTQGK